MDKIELLSTLFQFYFSEERKSEFPEKPLVTEKRPTTRTSLTWLDTGELNQIM